MKTRDLISKHESVWRDAVVHPFLDECATASIAPASFNRWLVQDRMFVVAFSRFAANMLQECPPAHMDALMGGLTALRDELEWFAQKAGQRGLRFDVPQLPACAEYIDFMRSLYAEPYAAKATAFWAIEKAYNDAWSRPGVMAPPYDEFSSRWGSDGFTAYVELLARQADDALSVADAGDLFIAERAFLDVARLEKDFWQMAYADPLRLTRPA